MMNSLKILKESEFISIKMWPKNKTQFRVYFNIKDGKHPPIHEILAIANEWSPGNQTLFVVSYSEDESDVRVSFHGSNWSKVANDDSKHKITMELNCLYKQSTISAENKAQILHEFGHVLGLVHGHQLQTSPIKNWNIEKLREKHPNDINDAYIKENYMKKYNPIPGADQFFDQFSIMNYSIPQDLIKSGTPTTQNMVLSSKDKELVAKMYSQTL